MAILQIAGDKEVPGSEVPASVERPHLGRGENGDIGLIVEQHVFIHHSLLGGNLHRRDFACESRSRTISINSVRDLAPRKSGGSRNALLAGPEQVIQGAKARSGAFDVFE